MKKYLILALVLILPVITAAQSNPVISFKAGFNDKGVNLSLSIPKNHYAYLSSPYSIPVTIRSADNSIVKFGKPVFPKGIKKEKELIIKGHVRVFIPVISWGSTKKGVKSKLEIIVKYQLCNEAKGVCYIPVTIRVRAYGLLKKTLINRNLKKNEISKAKENKKDISFSEKIKLLLKENLQNPLIAFLLAVFGGFLASLTPCVYPVIPITVGYFSKMSEGGGGKARGRFMTALVYVAGMSIVYTLLGVLAGLTGSLFGELTNTPVFFVLVGLLFFLLALSLFDVFEIKMPGFLSKLQNRPASSSKKGYMGPFIMGIATGLVASPCVGPIIFFLLTGVLQKGSVLYGTLLMMGFSIGMGFLFMFLAVFSQSASKLPKSGNWMVRIKIVLGVLVLGSAFYFIDLAVKTLFGGLTVFWIIFAVLVSVSFILAAIKLKKLYGSSGKVHSIILAVLLVLLTVFFIAASNQEKLKWSDNYSLSMTEAKKKGKPVFLDLYADWCAICKKMETEILNRPELRDYLKKNFITLKMNYDKHKEFLQKRFGVKSLPWVLILRDDGKVIWKKVGFDNAKNFADNLMGVLKRITEVRHFD